MAKINLDRLPAKQYGQNPYKFADLHIDLESNFVKNSSLFQQPEINDFKLDYDIEAVKNSLVTLFTTMPGQKILNPEYGLDLKQFLFLPMTIMTGNRIRDEIYTQIARFEPRVKVLNVKITMFEDVNEFDIDIYYDIPSLNISNIRLFGTLSNSGYVFSK